MNWITQSYEGEVHVVPDTEAGHVLSPVCFCAPAQEDDDYPQIWTHFDELDRFVGVRETLGADDPDDDLNTTIRRSLGY